MSTLAGTSRTFRLHGSTVGSVALTELIGVLQARSGDSREESGSEVCTVLRLDQSSALRNHDTQNTHGVRLAKTIAIRSDLLLEKLTVPGMLLAN